MTVIKDLLESQAVRQTEAGFAADRVFLVTDVTGNANARLYNALLTPQLPQYGEPHPIIPEIQVTDIQATPLSNDPEKVKVRVSYSVPTGEEDTAADEEEGVTEAKISITTNLTDEFEFQDINGNLLKAEFAGVVAGGFAISTKYGDAEIQRPQLQVSFERKESSIPKSVINEYLGTVNGGAWSGFPAKTWLCTGINAREDNPDFLVTYTFAHRAETWRLEMLVNLSQQEAEAFPIDVDSGNGYAVYDVYKLRDFNAIGLSF